MLRILSGRLLFAALLISLCSPLMQTAEAANAAVGSVAHSFASKSELNKFVSLFNAKGATTKRMVMLNTYVAAEMQYINQLNKQLLSRYKIHADKNYVFDAKYKTITEQPKAQSKHKKGKVIYKLKGKKEVQAFVQTQQKKEAAKNRIKALQDYLHDEKIKIDQISAQLLKKYHIESTKNYRFEPENMRLLIAPATKANNTAALTGKTLTVAVDVGNARSKPNRSGRLLFKLKRGMIVSELARKGSWIKIRTSSGQTAWAHKVLF